MNQEPFCNRGPCPMEQVSANGTCVLYKCTRCTTIALYDGVTKKRYLVREDNKIISDNFKEVE